MELSSILNSGNEEEVIRPPAGASDLTASHNPSWVLEYLNPNSCNDYNCSRRWNVVAYLRTEKTAKFVSPSVRHFSRDWGKWIRFKARIDSTNHPWHVWEDIQANIMVQDRWAKIFKKLFQFQNYRLHHCGTPRCLRLNNLNAALLSLKILHRKIFKWGWLNFGWQVWWSRKTAFGVYSSVQAINSLIG